MKQNIEPQGDGSDTCHCSSDALGHVYDERTCRPFETEE